MAQKPFRWYVIHAYSGFEKKVCDTILEDATKKGIREQFDQLLVPAQEVSEVRKGTTIKTERKFFPGYILARMRLTDEAWNLVKNTPRVTDFLGARGRPLPVPDREAQEIIHQLESAEANTNPLIRFEIGETVEVTDGAFASFNGIVEDVNHGEQILKVSVTIFGRATPVELRYNQVEKR